MVEGNFSFKHLRISGCLRHVSGVYKDLGLLMIVEYPLTSFDVCCRKGVVERHLVFCKLLSALGRGFGC